MSTNTHVLQQTWAKVIIYYRISTELQTFEAQQHENSFALQQLNLDVRFCDEVYEQGSAALYLPHLQNLLHTAPKKTLLITYTFDRLTRSEASMLELIQILKQRQITVYLTKERRFLDLSTFESRLIAVIMAMFAEHEKDRIKARMRAGIAAFKKKHGRWGPKHKITPYKAKMIKKYREHGISWEGIARLLEINSHTILNWRRRTHFDERFARTPSSKKLHEIRNDEEQGET